MVVAGAVWLPRRLRLLLLLLVVHAWGSQVPLQLRLQCLHNPCASVLLVVLLARIC